MAEIHVVHFADRDQVHVGMGHFQADDRYADPGSAGGFFYPPGHFLGKYHQVGQQRIVHVKDVIDLLFRNHQGVAFLQREDIQESQEAVVLCEVGGVIGVIFGIAAGNAAAYFLKVPPEIPIDWTIFGLIICSIVGIVFGTYPAIKAANLDPIESLRYE